MTHNRERVACSRCQAKETRSVTGVCSICRAADVPTVERCADGLIRVAGIGPLPIDKALQLAHRIADECTP